MRQDAVKKNVVKKMNDHLAFVETQKTIMPNVETSNRCPLQCPQCTRSGLLERKSTNKYKEIKQRIDRGFDLSLEDAKKLLEFFDMGIMLCGSISDPVYWKHFIDFLKLRKEFFPNKRIRVYTAASQKNIEWYKKAFSMCNSNDVWIFGIDGMTVSEIYRKGQNSNLMFDAMLLAKSMNIGVEWQYIVFKHNIHELEEAKKFSDKHNIKLNIMKSNRTGGGVEVPDNWKPKRNKEVIHDIV
jgi:hypothetical protein